MYDIGKTTAGNAPINRLKQMDSDKSVNYSHSFLANILQQSQLANATSETNMELSVCLKAQNKRVMSEFQILGAEYVYDIHLKFRKEGFQWRIATP